MVGGVAEGVSEKTATKGEWQRPKGSRHIYSAVPAGMHGELLEDPGVLALPRQAAVLLNTEILCDSPKVLKKNLKNASK